MADRPRLGPAWTRRQVLLAGSAGAALALNACSGSAEKTPVVRPGAPFAQPEVLSSSDGRLEVTLTARAGMVPHGDGTRFAYTYNGTTPGPTLRVRPGDTLVITLVNRLDEPTNLHTHGLHVSPEGDSDNVFVAIEPGQSRTYTYVLPEHHRSSMCWYHPHHHGTVAPQLGGGLYGAIIVEDGIDQLPEIAGATERVFLLSDPTVGADRSVLDVSDMNVMWGREGDAALVNGLHRPALAATAGTLERWRVLNASPSRYYRLALDGHRLQVIGADGSRLASPEAFDDLLLTPGERIEVLVAPAEAGSFSFRTRGYDRGSPGMGGGRMGGRSSASADGQELATMVVTGSATPAALPTRLLAAADLDAGVAGSERPIELAMGMGGGNGGMGGGMGGGGGGMMSFSINGESFDHERINITARAGETEDWVITNTSSMDHPFHLHAWPFRVISRTSGPPDVAGWKDTVNVPAKSSVTVRVPFTDITGRTVYHCHILDHEDHGMMGIIEVR
ncbi:MAG: multicopper oxidase family protein [Microthrixaceae bacterium]